MTGPFRLIQLHFSCPIHVGATMMPEMVQGRLCAGTAGGLLTSSGGRYMSLRLRAATATAALLLALAGPAYRQPSQAADLYGSEAYPPASPYNDPRYGDIYRIPAPERYAAPLPEAYRPGYDGPPVRHDRNGYLREMPPHGFSLDGRTAAGCLPRGLVHDQLARRGWSDFQALDLRGDVAFLRARRVNGSWFDLTVDRCSGQVLAARLVDSRSAYADGGRYGPGYAAPGYPGPGYHGPGPRAPFHSEPRGYETRPGYDGYQGPPGY
jgi:hypothetical protein